MGEVRTLGRWPMPGLSNTNRVEGQIIRPRRWSVARVVIVSWVFAATWVAVALLWNSDAAGVRPICFGSTGRRNRRHFARADARH